ncbi:MAG TPA: YezD family protein [Candidatus Acidoferrum sp.]|nr:YezD family protein [Candidatus Acidoferrum sp.]
MSTASTSSTTNWQQDLSASERDLLREVALALRGIRYGSVVLTVHDGRIVELNKTERIRKSGT